MTLGELNTLINNNVYENTERAITGGALQNVLQGMMGAFFGTSTLSGIGSLVSKDMRDAIGTTLGSNSSLIGQLANNLATNYTFTQNFGSNLATNYTFAQNLATSWSFITTLAINTNFGSYLASNSSLTMKLSTDSTFCSSLAPQIALKIATASGFQESLNCRNNYDSGTIPFELVYNSSFISGLKSQLGL